MHRDLKPDNIMIKNSENYDRICLADFGFSTFFDLTKKESATCGSLIYMAPEIMVDKRGYDQKVDIWALGITVLFMLLGYDINLYPNPKTGKPISSDSEYKKICKMMIYKKNIDTSLKIE